MRSSYKAFFLAIPIQFFSICIEVTKSHAADITESSLILEGSIDELDNEFGSSDNHLFRGNYHSSSTYPISPELRTISQLPEGHLEESPSLRGDFGNSSPEPEDIPFFISGLKFVGNSFFTNEELCSAALEVINSFRDSGNQIAILDVSPNGECAFSTPAEVTFGLLSSVRTAIDQNLLNRGFITSGSYIPVQDLESLDTGYAFVEIGIVEEYLDGIIVEEYVNGIKVEKYVNGIRETSDKYLEDYVCRAFQVYLGESQGRNGECGPFVYTPLNQEKLVNALELLQNDPLMTQGIHRLLRVDAKLKRENGRDLLVLGLYFCRGTSECPDTLVSSSIGVNNNRSPGIGNIESRFRLSALNLIGKPGSWGTTDQLSFEYAQTEGSDTLDIELSLPIERFGVGGSLNLGYQRYRGNVVEAPFNRLDLTSNSELITVSLKGPLAPVTPQNQQYGNFVLEIYQSESFLLDEPFPISLLESNEDGESLVTSIGFDYANIFRTPNQIYSWLAGLEVGSNITDSQGFFLIGNLQGQAYQRITPDIFLLLNVYTQLSTSSLPSIKQLGIGGQTSVRGYRPGFLLTDNGLLGRAELQYHLPISQDQKSRIQLVCFFDLGYGWNNSDLNLPTNLAMSTGVGIHFWLGDYLSTGVDYGIPIVSNSFGDSNTQNFNFHVNFNFDF